MKIGGSTGAAPATGASPRREAAPSGFAPAGASATGVSAAAPPAASTVVSGIDALLALQEPQDALSRRRRAVRRATGVLDGLDALKLAMLGEGDSTAALERLSRALRERADAVDEPELGDLLAQVETRAAVEIAKREAIRAAA
jgi:hypothetical protein